MKQIQEFRGWLNFVKKNYIYKHEINITYQHFHSKYNHIYSNINRKISEECTVTTPLIQDSLSKTI